MKDPYHRRIVEALENGEFDPEAFERCMGDLLRDAIPGLVPVPGGQDGGFDGAIADGKGEPYPLICTTQEDVIGNLTGTLKKLRETGSRRRAVLATSRALTNRRREDLLRRAELLGFTLMQIFHQESLADRLYHSPRWSRELLGLSGTPCALSTTPKTSRRQLEIDLVGRDLDLEWLRATKGDRLVVGEPGSGKTYLLRSFVREGRGLFLVDGDRTALANALRERRPEAVIVDDAHAYTEELETLHQLREDLGFEFSIVASSWKGARARIADAMGALPEERIRDLELLTRRQILEVIEQVGIRGDQNEELQRILIDQAANKPGLAVTLALVCCQGDWREVVTGKTLLRIQMLRLQPLVGREAVDVLAALSLGGDRGMRLDPVADFLGLDPSKRRNLVVDLAAGGVLSERENELVVWPSSLRATLLREVFFSGSTTGYDYRQLIGHVPDLEAAVSAIVLAVHLGAQVDKKELSSLVSQSERVQIWRQYAQLGRDEAKWVLEHYPRNPIEIAREVLFQAPQEAILRLLEIEAGVPEALYPGIEPSMHPFRDWIEDFSAPPKEALRRRKLLAQQAKKTLRRAGGREVGIRALCLALSPLRSGRGANPADGKSITVRSGIQPLSCLREMGSIWSDVRPAIEELDRPTWVCLTRLFWDWIYPPGRLPGQVRDEMRAFVATALGDLADFAAQSPGLTAGLNRLAGRAEVKLALNPDPEFELLFPPDPVSLNVRKVTDSVDLEEVHLLAEEWAHLPGEEVARKLSRLVSEARRIGYPRVTHRPRILCTEVARFQDRPDLWIESFLDQALPGHLIEPFLERLLEARPEGWDHWIEVCLNQGETALTATSLILTRTQPAPSLLRHALDAAVEFPQLVETLCLRSEVSLPVLRQLLRHRDWKVALAAAIGEWNSDPEGQVREEILADWRSAILGGKLDDGLSGSGGFGFWLLQILASDSGSAFERLKRDLARGRNLESEEDFSSIEALTRSQRAKLLEILGDGFSSRSALRKIIGKDPFLYRELLSRSNLSSCHLAPLEQLPDAPWLNMAEEALAAGYQPGMIAEASFRGPLTFSGYGQHDWEKWRRAFAKIENHAKEAIRQVARHGQSLARKRIESGAATQRRTELHGVP